MSHRPGRSRGDLTPHQRSIVERLLSDRAWILEQLGAESIGLSGLREQSFCVPEWLSHFDVGGASRSTFRTTNPDDEAAVRVRDNIAALSLSLSRSLAEAIADGFVPRAASGWQFTFSNGVSRAMHTDKAHLGSLILTVTLEGDCTIEVEDALARDRIAAPRWTFTQQPDQCYAIWGPSRDAPVRHAVTAGEQPRLSVTLRFPQGRPPAVGRLLPGQSWALNDVCEARFHAKDFGEGLTKWFAGRISAVNERLQLYSIRYDDGDEEDSVPLRFIRQVQSTGVEDRVTRRAGPSRGQSA